MATPKIWKNVAVAMQSALGSVLTISAITKANPGVVTSTAHGLANGNFVLFAVLGMFQVNGRVYRIANVTANTFELDGTEKDTTLFDTFSSGSAQLVSYGNTITTATQVTSSGGTFPLIDTTTIHDSAKSSIPGMPDAYVITFDNIWDISDAGLQAMRAAFVAQSTRCFRLTFGVSGNIVAFNGFVGANLFPGGQAQALVTSPAVITALKDPTYYVS